jgi:hypothetical protein
VVVDSEDIIVTTGWSHSGTTKYLSAIEYDKVGNQLWAISNKDSLEYGAFFELRGYGVAVDSFDNIVIAGASSHALGVPTDFFTVKLRAAGMPLVQVNDIVVDGNLFQVVTESNSTISALVFAKENKKLLFNVTGTTGTTGFCNITIPNQLLGGPYSSSLDGQPLSATITLDNGTHTGLGFNYVHSAHRIEIIGTTAIPEFPSTMLLPLLALTTLVAAVLAGKSRRKKRAGLDSF